jgi:hypothetical protein
MRSNREQMRMQAMLESSNLQIDLDRLSFAPSVVRLPDLFIPHEVRIASDQEIEGCDREAKNVGASGVSINVYWRFGSAQHLATSVRDCLPAFIKLAHADQHGIAEFVRRWGPLHYLTETDPDTDNYGPYVWRYEPIALYQQMAKHYESVLHTAADLHKEQPASLEHWQWVLWPKQLKQQDWPALRADIGMQKSLLAAILNGIISDAEIKPYFRWQTERLELMLGTDNNLSLFWGDFDDFEPNREDKGEIHVRTVLAIQLAAAVMSPYGVWKCDVCGNFYNPPNRRGRGDGQHLCSQECRTVRRRQIARQYQQRRRSKE